MTPVTLPAARNTIKTPLLRHGVDRQGQWCKCSKCGLIARCAPEQDFYGIGMQFDLLACQSCAIAMICSPSLADVALEAVERAVHAPKYFPKVHMSTLHGKMAIICAVCSQVVADTGHATRVVGAPDVYVYAFRYAAQNGVKTW